MLNESVVQSVVHAEIRDLLAEAGTELETLTGSERLHELGLSSLMLARLIIQLESGLGVDPFAEDLMLSEIDSVSELIAAYETAERANA